MKKINLKKLVLKKTNIIELNSQELRAIVGGNTEVSPNSPVALDDKTDPRSMYSMFCPA
ncbi:MAG: rSAM-modified peptide [Flavobacterium sp.]|nr:MAG: rSAM-modified peptide [Flavobacterium sp.]